MKHEFQPLPPGGRRERIPLYDGIELSYEDISSDSFSVEHEAWEHIIQIRYCRAGQVVWNMKSGNRMSLKAGDFSLHTMCVCADSTVHVPAGRYQGLTISVDLRKVSACPPEAIAGTGIFEGLLWEKFRLKNAAAFFAGNRQTQSIFDAFYDQPEALRRSYQRVMTLELFLYLARVEVEPQACLTEYLPEQVQMIQEIHNWLLQHMDQRITIGALSKQYLVNPTTLKAAFKAVYGTSLAAHIKKHRLDRAAQLLQETDMCIAEIAQVVGYDSQSKFAAAFKGSFQMLPREYRKQVSEAGKLLGADGKSY